MGTASTYILLVVSVTLLTAGQAMQKVAVDRIIRHDVGDQHFFKFAREPAIWLAMLCLAGSMSIWLSVLYRIDVSKALPFVSLGHVFVLIVSRVFFGEHISVLRWLGAGLIAVGIVLIAQT